MSIEKIKKTNKTSTIQIRLEPKTKKQIQKLAKLEGLTVTAFGRRAILEDLNQRLKPQKEGVQNVEAK